VHDLLMFARPRTPRMGHVVLGPLVESTATLVRRDPEFADVDVRVTGGQHSIQADAELLQIVLSNLMLNAAQAMEGEGRIDVAIRRRDGWCDLVISDTGPGMPAETRDRLFEPFYTTKHRGTGLGLPTAKRLVELHGGTIAAACPAGGGTTVTISFPAAEAGRESSLEHSEAVQNDARAGRG
jgi:signal transduction histidine kinase